jgi:hypothetical protein
VFRRRPFLLLLGRLQLGAWWRCWLPLLLLLELPLHGE